MIFMDVKGNLSNIKTLSTIMQVTSNTFVVEQLIFSVVFQNLLEQNCGVRWRWENLVKRKTTNKKVSCTKEEFEDSKIYNFF